MTGIKTGIGLLLLAITVTLTVGIQEAFAGVPTTTFPTIISLDVNTDQSVDMVCTDPTSGDPITGRVVRINDTPFGASPNEVTVGGNGDLASIICDGSSVNNISIAGFFADEQVVNFRLRIFETGISPANSRVDTTFTVDTTAPVLTLTGDNLQFIDITTAYIELGATAIDNVDGDITGSIVIDASVVDVDAKGDYIVTYDVTDSAGNSSHEERTVTVVDNIPPVITLIGVNPQFLNLFDPYVELGATASDIDDGDISGSIVIDASLVDTSTHGDYIVTYDVTDSSGNDAIQVTRTVIVVDNIPPVITLIGDAVIEQPYGLAYVDAGATASDVDDGDITGDIVVVNPVDVFQALTSFTITYDVTDSSGNDATQVTRTVNIGERPNSSNERVWATKPTFALNHLSGKQLVDVGFTMNNKDYKLTDNWHTPFDKVKITTGTSNDFVLHPYAQYGIKKAELAFVPKIGAMGDSELSIEVWTDCRGNVVKTNVVQDEQLVVPSLISATIQSDKNQHHISINNVMFMEQPYFEVVALEAVDCRNRVQTTFLNEGIDIVGDSFNEATTVMIPNEGKPVYSLLGDNSNMQKLTLIDKFSNIWENEDGILYTTNEYDSWVKVTPDKMVRFNDDTETVMTRQNSNFVSLVDYQENTALETMKELYPSLFSEPEFAEIHNIKVMDSVEVTQREITLSKLSWYNSN